jgi:REP element-mobilizing transposase RayT
MPPEPIYTSKNVPTPAYQLRFSWACWPSGRAVFPPWIDVLFEELAVKWDTDGIRRLESDLSLERIQMTVSVKPHVSPVVLAARLKGRLDHALRQAGNVVTFSRKISLRSLGDATRTTVEQYIRNQIPKERYVDRGTEALLSQFTVRNAHVDLFLPTETNSGRYWYNLHLVLVTAGRQGCFDTACLKTIRDGCFQIAAKKGYLISIASAVPDHLLVAMRGNIEHSPQDIALAYMNNLAYLAGKVPIWDFGYYVGTFGEYDMRSVRR